MKKFLIAFFTLLAPAIGGASNIADDAKLLSIDEFAGGLNTLHPAHKLPPTFSPYMRNVFIDEGKIQTVNGYSVLGSSNVLSKVTGIFPFVLENGSVYFLVTDSSITLETQDFRNWIFVSSGSNSGAILNWFQARNKMWGVNGIDNVITWDHTSKTILNGNNGTPNVPKFRYGEYYQDRVWGFNIPGGASDLYFSSVISTDNVIIAPDDYRAWPPINATYVGRGDGTIGTGLFIYGGRLRAAKERSVYTIQGDNPSNYLPVKEEGQVGVTSDESVALLDKNVYWLGQDGIYENAKRISDLIQPDVDNFNKSQSSILTNTWDSKAEFQNGQFFGSTATASNVVSIETTTFRINHLSLGDLPTTGYIELTSTGTQFSQYGIAIPTVSIPSNFSGYVTGINFRGRAFGNCAGNNPSFDFVIENTKSRQRGRLITGDLTCSDTFITYSGQTFYTPNLGAEYNSTPLFTPDELRNNFSIQITTRSGMTAGLIFQIFPATMTHAADITLKSATTVQYMSEVSTLTSLVAWGRLDSINNTNGGTVNYYVRTATSAVNITTQTWSPIVPGANISAPTINNYMQWAATITSISPFPESATNIDQVTISHVEGQASIQRPIAIDWNNRYWLSVSTTSDTSLRAIYVKGKITNQNSDAWMPIDGVNACSFARIGDVLYGGSCSTGTVLRLDYGTNYNGVAIPSIYQTPELDFGDNYFDKKILKYMISGDKNMGGIMTVGTSINEGTITNSTFSISGSGYYNKIIEGVTDSAQSISLQLSENDLDQKMILHNISILYRPTRVIKDK